MLNKFLTIIRKIYANVSYILFRKIRAAFIIYNDPFPIRSGYWIIGTDFSRSLKVRKLPPPLNQVKIWGDWQTLAWLRVVMSALRKCVPPWISVRGDKSNASYHADILLISRAGDLIGFDVRKFKVIRKMDKKLACLAVERRNKVSMTYPCPRMYLEDGLLIEDMIYGAAFSRAGPTERRKVFAFLLECLSSATSENILLDDIESWKRGCFRIIERYSKLSEKLDLEYSFIDEIIELTKTGYVHGDITGDNVIVTADGSYVIDHELYGAAPIFTELMTLIMFEARNHRNDLLVAFLKGEFDKDFFDLEFFRKKNLTMPDRHVVVISWLGWKTVREDISNENITRFLQRLLSVTSCLERASSPQ